MPATHRPRRSVLYMPGSKPRALEKARAQPADAQILDLEDAVGPEEKVEAREIVCAATREKRFGAREVILRVNGLDTEWGREDIAAACAAGPDAILAPKVGAPADVAALLEAMEEAGAPAECALWAMIETPAGVLAAASIAAASDRLACFVMGTNDLVNEIGARDTPDRAPILGALQHCLLAARAHGLACIDGVYNAYRDEEGLRAACAQGRDMGFDGKTLIHPAQIAAANESFAPTEGELDLARRQLAAFEATRAAGQAVAVVDGRIVENLHVENARRLLASAAAIARLEAETG